MGSSMLTLQFRNPTEQATTLNFINSLEAPARKALLQAYNTAAATPGKTSVTVDVQPFLSGPDADRIRKYIAVTAWNGQSSFQPTGPLGKATSAAPPGVQVLSMQTGVGSQFILKYRGDPPVNPSTQLGEPYQTLMAQQGVPDPQDQHFSEASHLTLMYQDTYGYFQNDEGQAPAQIYAGSTLSVGLCSLDAGGAMVKGPTTLGNIAPATPLTLVPNSSPATYVGTVDFVSEGVEGLYQTKIDHADFWFHQLPALANGNPDPKDKWDSNEDANYVWRP